MNTFPLPSSLALSDVQACPKPMSPPSTFRRQSSRSRYCLTYAEWITRALVSTKDKRACLADIYEWMAFNVPGLQEQRFLHSSKGWKNAVRHTLSINPRFRKLKRFGKPALWTLADDHLRQTEELLRSNNGRLGTDTLSAFFVNPQIDAQPSTSREEATTSEEGRAQPTTLADSIYPDRFGQRRGSHSTSWPGLSESYSHSYSSISAQSILPTVSSDSQPQNAYQLPLSVGPVAQFPDSGVVRQQQEYQRILASLATSTADHAAQRASTLSTTPRSSTQVLQVATLSGSEATFLVPRPLPVRCLTDHKLFLASLLWPNYSVTAHQ